MSGLIGKKLGMTTLFSGEEGKVVPCTLVELGPCVVTQVKTVETDGYSAVQLGFSDKKEKNTTKGELGHFKKAKTAPKAKVTEFKSFDANVSLGQILTSTDVFAEGDKVTVVGTSKGKGFQGVVKRHNFGGVGMGTHGQHNRQRHAGSIGSCSFPARVFKGLKMAGRMGGARVKVKNLKIVKMLPEQNLVIVSGSLPGANNSFIYLEK